MTALAPTLQAFFTDRLVGQRGASPNTVAAYRTTMQLLVRFAATRTGKRPVELDIGDLDAPLVSAFLDHLERDRHNSPRTRNNRLAAIHSLFGYAALRYPEHASCNQRVLAIPAKRHERNLVSYLTDEEGDALLAACNPATRTGHAMLLLAVQTGLRISELASLTCADLTLGTGANVHTVGKGRKERRTPLVPHTVIALRAWLAERGDAGAEPLFPTITGKRLSRDAIEHRIALYAGLAAERCVAASQAPDCPHASAHLRHEATSRRRRRHRDRAVARTFPGLHHRRLLACRHDPKGESHRPRHAARNQTWPLSPRCPPRLPERPVIMPTSSGRSPSGTRALPPGSA